MIVVRDAGSVLVHAHDGGIDHLHRRIMTGGQRIHVDCDKALKNPSEDQPVYPGDQIVVEKSIW